ncbi:peptidoglycan-associated lipoprotein Pal [Methylomarinum sp. Ch1-1]|uniref:Peptidoglycan-associated lipoprotein n=1 Tax=Methylomarinum roseum TaxID=3067653 RepID=A0AAU7NU75_9GAMM|nr:peptidoglycan-associated lipoprotein Pal [Methylomarinum sp. Ch1-1]MDP4519407.1 peptidoglycan-associated lipoprotein Pal [Methylomarinum sp. Ch1-1]
MKFSKTYLALAATAFLLSGCSSTEEKGADLLEGGQSAAVEGAATSGYSEGAGIGGGEMITGELSPEEMGAEFTDPQNPLSKHTIYFMYDSSQVQQDFIPVIAAHSQYLLAHPAQRLVLEGHADERGSPEYNIALGEQRAKSVARMMKVQGVAESQLEVVSYGEEKPDATGHDEAAWQLNRRVELVYQAR